MQRPTIYGETDPKWRCDELDTRITAMLPARIASGSLGHAWITATKPASI